MDASTSQERQAESFGLLRELIGKDYKFADKEEAQEFFTRLTGLFKNWNYSPVNSPEYQRYRHEVQDLAIKSSQ